MKRILYLLLTIFTLGLFATSCQNDKPAQKPKSELRKKQQQKKANQRKANQKKKRKNQKRAKPAALPPISKLKKSTKQTQAVIRTINDKNPGKDKQPFRITEKTITVKGVAVDTPRKTAAAGVYVKIGKQFFKTNYGQPQKAFADRAKNPKYLKSGFTVKIPKAKIKQGDYDVSLYVVSSDRKTYYEIAKTVKVKIR